MKKHLILLTLLLSLTACGKEAKEAASQDGKPEAQTGYAYIHGEVTQNDEEGILLETDEGEVFLVPAQVADSDMGDRDRFVPGTKIQIEYDGNLSRSIPPQLMKVHSVVIGDAAD